MIWGLSCYAISNSGLRLLADYFFGEQETYKQWCWYDETIRMLETRKATTAFSSRHDYQLVYAPRPHFAVIFGGAILTVNERRLTVPYCTLWYSWAYCFVYIADGAQLLDWEARYVQVLQRASPVYIYGPDLERQILYTKLGSANPLRHGSKRHNGMGKVILRKRMYHPGWIRTVLASQKAFGGNDTAVAWLGRRPSPVWNLVGLLQHLESGQEFEKALISNKQMRCRMEAVFAFGLLDTLGGDIVMHA